MSRHGGSCIKNRRWRRLLALFLASLLAIAVLATVTEMASPSSYATVRSTLPYIRIEKVICWDYGKTKHIVTIVTDTM